MYEYNVLNLEVIDGDSVRFDIDLGFGIILRDQVMRLSSIDAFEIRRTKRAKDQAKMLGITLDEVIERGKMAKKRLNEIVENQKVSVRIEKRGKFGRHVGELLVDNVYPAESLIEEDLAFDY